MFKKKILLTCFFLVGLTMVNCEKEETCPPNLGNYFDIDGIKSLIHHHKISETAAPPLENNSKIDFEDYYGLVLRYSVNYYSCMEKPNSSFGFGQLYALSCIFSGEYGSSERYQNINVITLNDFNNEYSRGDTINDIISTGYYEPIKDFLLNADSTNIEWQNLTLFLNESPSLNSKFKVKVIIELANGETYSKESTTVEFN